AEEIARRREVRLGRRPALIDRFRLPRSEALDELLALELPLELAEAEHRLRHLARLTRRLGDERREETDRFSAEVLDLRHVALDARLELLLELLLQRLGDLLPGHRGLSDLRGRSRRRALARLRRRLRVDRALERRTHRRSARRRARAWRRLGG